MIRLALTEVTASTIVNDSRGSLSFRSFVFFS
jgi:hypothetical protein